MDSINNKNNVDKNRRIISDVNGINDNIDNDEMLDEEEQEEIEENNEDIYEHKIRVVKSSAIFGKYDRIDHDKCTASESESNSNSHGSCYIY